MRILMLDKEQREAATNKRALAVAVRRHAGFLTRAMDNLECALGALGKSPFPAEHADVQVRCMNCALAECYHWHGTVEMHSLHAL